jgi:hypothetical protein
VLVVYLQYMGMLHNLVIGWPPSMQRLISPAKLVLLPGSSGWVSLSCLGRTRASVSLRLHMVLALLLLALSCTLAFGSCMGALPARTAAPLLPKHRSGRLVWRLQHAQRLALADVAIAAAAVGLFLAYANMVSACLSTFSCLSVDGIYY